MNLPAVPLITNISHVSLKCLNMLRILFECWCSVWCVVNMCIQMMYLTCLEILIIINFLAGQQLANGYGYNQYLYFCILYAARKITTQPLNSIGKLIVVSKRIKMIMIPQRQHLSILTRE